MFEIIEVVIIVGIIILQLYLAFKLLHKIRQYKSIFDFEDLPVISQKNVSLEVFETGNVNDILNYNNEDERTGNVINITYLKYIPKSKVLETIVKYINVYLIKNKGASIDFHLIKDIVEKHTETIEDQIENRIPAPLYLGLVATMIGIIAGLFSVNFGDGNDALNAIQPLINGVKWAMSASVIGLLITTLFSIKIYKDAQTEADEEKSEFLSKLQSELMPKMATGALPEVSILSGKLDDFSRNTIGAVSYLNTIVNTSSKTVEREQKLIEDIKQLDVVKITSANIKIFNKLDGMMESFHNFAKYYDELNSSLTSTSDLLSNLKQFVKNTENVNVVLSEIKSTVIQSNEATSFFNKHIKSFQNYNEAVNEAVANNDSAFQEAITQLKLATQNQLESFNKIIASYDSQLTNAFDNSIVNFTKVMDLQVRRTEEAFENSRPKFEKLDKLDKLEKLDAIEERLVSLEGKLTNVISSGNKELVSAIFNLNGVGGITPNIKSKNVLGKVKRDLTEKILTILKITAYSVIIIYGVHSVLRYFYFVR